MKFIIENGSVRITYSNLENLEEQDEKIFRLMLHFHAAELQRDRVIYRLQTQEQVSA